MDVERELQVRLIAQRLLAQLLPNRDSPTASYDLDLTGACLVRFDLSGRKIGSLALRNARLLDGAHFDDCVVTGPVRCTAMQVDDGRLRCRGTVFHDEVRFDGTGFAALADFSRTRFLERASFKEVNFDSDADFREVTFAGSLDLSRVRFAGHLDMRLGAVPPTLAFYNTQVNPQRDVQLPPEWELLDRDNRVCLSVRIR
ncbi:pentapeptide repeat-containing protein [Nocardia sp. CDC159]|uniref:Pentapeptide repeat-containing protein n=1 Tax=Nocardia pulmonis TaxID=2951408 RepID=A0A9X2E4I0_9NOCA|nr:MULTISPECIES: pentapeptide repeat-containing protein [Nocardia]MCM6773674.1 pentapeptide repeat-containing protein [Nocardia pulmonis]MCM6786561.1 pentapeptide repeat-containing protein [Nocardia sp. CDC159]